MDKYGVAPKTGALNTNAEKNRFSLQFLFSVSLQISFTKFFLIAYSSWSSPLWGGAGGKDDKGDNMTHGATTKLGASSWAWVWKRRDVTGKESRVFFSRFFGEMQLLNLAKLSMETTHPT